MKKLLTNIVLLLIVIGITFGATRRYFPKTKEIVQTDTLRVDVPYEVEKIKEVEVPKKVIEYRTDTVRIESVRVERDTVFIETDLDTFIYSPLFLTNYPQAPKMLGISAEKDGISFTGLYPNGETQTKVWEYTPYWEIGYTDNGIGLKTVEKPLSDRLSHTISVGYLWKSDGSYPYGRYKANIDLLGVTFTGSGWLSQEPFVTAGVEYEF